MRNVKRKSTSGIEGNEGLGGGALGPRGLLQRLRRRLAHLGTHGSGVQSQRVEDSISDGGVGVV